jgi:hypothetical protein
MEYSVSGTTAQNTENFNFLTTTYSVEQARQDLDEALSEENIIKVYGSSLEPLQKAKDIEPLKEPILEPSVEPLHIEPLHVVKPSVEALERRYLGSFFQHIYIRKEHSPKNIFTTFRKAEGSEILKPKHEKYCQWLKDHPEPVDKESQENRIWKDLVSKKKRDTFPSIIIGGISKPYQVLIDRSGKVIYDKDGKIMAVGTGRKIDIMELSGAIVLDFDDDMDKSNMRTFEEIRTELENDEYTAMLFLSPSGNGYKVIVKHNLTDLKEYEELFNGLKNTMMRGTV